MRLQATPPLQASGPLQRLARRHRFFLGALAIHAALLWAVSLWHGREVAQAEVRSNQVQIQAHTQAAAQQGMRRRVDSLKAMASQMERLGHGAVPPDEQDNAATEPAASASSPTETAQAPQDMLAQARELRDSVRRIDQAAQARKMAELLKMPPDQALKQLEQQAADADRRDAAADAAAPKTDEQVLVALNRYEQQARESLQRLQAQRAQEHEGTAIEHGGGAAGHAGQGAGAGAGAGSGGAPDGAGAPGSGGGSADGGPGSRADGRRSAVMDTQARRYDGQQASPVFSSTQLHLGSGNAIGPGAPWANRIHVNRWYVIGPFDAPSASSIHTIYPPEQWVDLDGVYLGKGRRVLRWQYTSSTAYPLIPPDAAEQAVYYGYSEIVTDRARDVWLGLGADDDAKLWVNDVLFWTSGNQRKAWYTTGGVQALKQDIAARNLIEEKRLVHLRRGRNTVLFKLYNNPLDVFFSLVIEPVGDGR